MIALTSLASEADVKRGSEAGMDDYQVKLDREQIMIVVNRLLPQQAEEAALARPSAKAGEQLHNVSRV